MNPDIIPPEIKAMHAEYERLTSSTLTLDWTRLDAWRVFIGFRKPPFTVANLRVVVAHLRAVRKDAVLQGSLKFHNLIQRPDYFEEDLNIALRSGRKCAPKPKEVVVNGTARLMPDDGCGNAAVPIGEVIRKMREAASGHVS